MSACPSCENQNPADARFCNSCGASLQLSCPSCEASNPPGARFCNGCGVELGASAAAAERTPADYTPKHLADKILTGKSALEGERKQVTVLFADVKGSMAMAEGVDPEQWHAILDGFFSVLAEGVHRFEGTVNQYTGDGIMALFGAPIAHEDHAQRACYAALQMREELTRYAREVKREHGLSFSVRMGLHSGEVVVGKIGDDLRMDYTAQGHTVGLAARMQELASPDTAYMTGDTADLVAGYFELDDLGSFPVKGVSEEVPVFQLQSIGAVRTRFDASRARGLTRFVGRDDDMHVLDRALENARAGKGQVVGVVADAGTGKSRLCFEFLEHCRAEGLRVFTGGGVAHGKNLPLLPILQVFREYYGITEHDSDQLVREKIAGRMLLFDEEYREVLPVLFDFFGAPDPANPPPRMDPEARQRQLFGVMRKLTQQDVSQGIVVTLIEDLHWIDDASEVWLEEMVDAYSSSPQRLLIVNFRPEYHAAWMQKSWYQQIPLLPLGPEAIRELLDDLLGDDPSLASLADSIHARTAGNPFFTEEVVQTLVETGHLEGARGSYRLTTAVERLEVPTRVQPLLAGRIDRLPERDKQVLQTAAVIGQEFAEPILEAVAELPKGELEESLRALKMSEFIFEASLYPIAEYAFKHPLTQEVALDSQLRERRRRVHNAVARTIEAVHSEKLDEQSPLLAHHWEEAGQSLIAARWHARAADWVGTSDVGASVRHWQRSRELVKEVPDEAEAALLGGQACRHLLALAFRIGMSRDSLDALFEEGAHWTELSQDSDEAALVRNAYAIALLISGAVEDSLPHSHAAEALMRQARSDELRGLAPWGTAYHLFVVGPVSEAANRLDELEAATRGHIEWGLNTWDIHAFPWAHFMRGAVDIFRGDCEEARRRLDRGLELAREHGDVETEGFAAQWQSELAFLTGEDDVGVGAGQRAVELGEKLGSPYSRSGSRQKLGRSLVAAGQLDAGIEMLEESLGICRDRGTVREMEAWIAAELSEGLRARDDLEKARALAEEAVTLSAKPGYLGRIMSSRVLARVLMAQEGADGAQAIEQALERADRAVDESGAVIYRPHLLLERAELARLQGDEPAREQHLRAAHALFVEFGATGHAERLAAELGL